MLCAHGLLERSTASCGGAVAGRWTAERFGWTAKILPLDVRITGA